MKKETFNQDRKNKQEFKKNEERLRTLWDNFKLKFQHPNHRGARRIGRARN